MLDLLFKNVDHLIDMVLAFITMSLGLNLSKQDFANIIKLPGSLTIGLIAQMILLPASAFALMFLTDFSPELKVGFMIISLCPGGVTSNLVTYLLKGNVALSISLTVVNGILCMFTLPFLVNLSLNFFLNRSSEITLPVLHTIEHIALVTIVPALAGMLLRNKLPGLADKLRPVLSYLLPAMLLMIFAVKFFAPPDNGGVKISSQEFREQTYWVLALNFSGMFLGYFLGRIFRINLRNRVTIMSEVGLQNSALALLIAGNILQNAEMQKPAMVYAVITFFSTLVFAWLIKTISLQIAARNDKKN